MQGVPELMQEGVYLVEGEQGGAVGLRFREVHGQGNVRARAVQAALCFAIIGHPCPTLFAVARMEIRIKHGEMAAVGIFHLVCLHIGVVNGDIRIFLKGDAVEARGQSEHALYHVAQLEVRAQLLGIEIVLLAAQEVRVIGKIPRLKVKIVPFYRLGLCFHACHVLAGGGKIGLGEILQKLPYVLGRFRHAMFQDVSGIIGITQQLRLLAAQVRDAANDGEVIVLVAVGAKRVVEAIQFLAALAAFGIGHKGYEVGGMERYHPALQTALRSVLSGCAALQFGQAVEFLLVGDVEIVVVGIFQFVLRKLQREFRKFRAYFAKALLARFVERGSRAFKCLIGIFEQHRLFRVLGLVLAIHRFHPFVKAGIEHDVIAVFRQNGGYALRQVFQVVVGMRAEQIIHQRGGSFQQFAGSFEGFDCIFKGRRVGVVHDGGNGLVFGFHAGVDGLFYMGYRDVGERIYAVNGGEGEQE